MKQPKDGTTDTALQASTYYAVELVGHDLDRYGMGSGVEEMDDGRHRVLLPANQYDVSDEWVYVEVNRWAEYIPAEQIDSIVVGVPSDYEL